MKLKTKHILSERVLDIITHKSSDCSGTCASYKCLPKESAKAHQVSDPAKLGSEGG